MVQVLLPTVSPEFAALVSEGVFQPSVFYFADGGDTSAAFAARVRTLPRFELGPRDTAIPSELAKLPPDAEVIFRQGGDDTVGKAGDVAEAMQATISERLGPFGERIRLGDLHRVLLDASGLESAAQPLYERVKTAASTRALRVRHPETDLSEDFVEWPEGCNMDLVCTVDDVNEWLATDGAGYRLCVAVSEPASTQTGQSVGDDGAVHRSKHQRYTPDERKDLLRIFRSFDGRRAKEGRAKRNGALQRTVVQTGIDKDTLGDQLDRAIDEERANQALTQLHRR